MNIRKHIPNVLTCGNLLCGCWGIAQAYQHSLKVAAVMVVSGAIFDFFDGLVARWLNASSPIGK
ncbi:MAG: CDP-alcohol phosphatidyltransferase family protein, partial [Flammeovirgaceae bacterium]|nr:CDP-alcohol phosphatidyltransferase family protein [Flammeovirgaceae bacterium]MDW8288939.1 CDP-alcohol phosphatidyltransferase family protein [Flammeovirgaceae bacterium]